MQGPEGFMKSAFFREQEKAWELGYILMMSGVLALLSK
jgi:hypothetical protein